MDIILVPGMWLDASSWDAVVPHLARAGHRARPLTLPGMTRDADRSRVTLEDTVGAIVAAIDAVPRSDGSVVLVGHSLGGALVHAAMDRRVDRVARLIYVGGEPAGDGALGGGGFPVTNGEIPLPEWSSFDAEMVADLDDAQRARLRERAIPVPARVTTDALTLTDPRRYDVPITMITCEYPSATYRKWIERGEPGTAELAKIRDVTWVDLGTGHWPQVTRPADLARAILASV